jgi:hypothetical protein
MHAYRDAIRGDDNRRAVHYAVTLYPGPETRYGDRIEALSARPLEPAQLDERLQTVLTAALTSVALAASEPVAHPLVPGRFSESAGREHTAFWYVTRQ